MVFLAMPDNFSVGSVFLIMALAPNFGFAICTFNLQFSNFEAPPLQVFGVIEFYRCCHCRVGFGFNAWPLQDGDRFISGNRVLGFCVCVCFEIRFEGVWQFAFAVALVRTGVG